jgi:hypothetical protein
MAAFNLEVQRTDTPGTSEREAEKRFRRGCLSVDRSKGISPPPLRGLDRPGGLVEALQTRKGGLDKNAVA